MINQSQHYRVPVVFCTVPVNLRDWLPTVSTNRLCGEKLEQWQTLFDQARRCLIQNDYQAGIQAMNQAIAMESEDAESFFWLGRLLEADGQKTAAREAYSKARDKDYNPFRALSSFNDAIRGLGPGEPGSRSLSSGLGSHFRGGFPICRSGLRLVSGLCASDQAGELAGGKKRV